jgi:tellurite resistance protein
MFWPEGTVPVAFRSPRIERLRDRLLRRGARSTVTAGWSLTAAAPSAQAAYDRILPYAEAIYLVIAADGVHTPEERDALLGAIRYLTEGELGAHAADHMITRFQRSLDRDGIEVRLDDVAARIYGEPADGELALSLAAAVAVADGQPGPIEERTIMGLAERLGFSPTQLRELLAGGDAT